MVTPDEVFLAIAFLVAAVSMLCSPSHRVPYTVSLTLGHVIDGHTP